MRALSLGRLEGDAEAVTGVDVDSRRIRPGDLFVAVSGGEAFLDDARKRGAAATLVPDDAHAALAALGSAVRARSDARVVAITGSVGKTSTKDILAALLRPHLRTVAAEDGFNNEIGLPLTLCRAEPDTDVLVTEMAMRGAGQIRDLARAARPHIGVITSIAPVHLEALGSLENIARAKAELLEELPTGAVAILPDDVPELEPFVPEGLDVGGGRGAAAAGPHRPAPPHLRSHRGVTTGSSSRTRVSPAWWVSLPGRAPHAASR